MRRGQGENMASLNIVKKFAARILTLLVAIAILIMGVLYAYIEWFGRRANPQAGTPVKVERHKPHRLVRGHNAQLYWPSVIWT